MKNAIQAVLENKMGYYLAAKTFGVPQNTLERKLKLIRSVGEAATEIKVPLGPKFTIFSKEEEAEIVKYTLDLEKRLFGLTTNDLRFLAYQLAQQNQKVHKFNTDSERAGKDWLLGFMKRHPEISIRKPENTSAARAAGFNKVAVDSFFNLLGETLDPRKISPDRTYNTDETGVSIVPKSKCKIIARTGSKQVGSLSSAERGATITVVVCFNAVGHYMPSMMIFPRKRMKPELMINAP